MTEIDVRPRELDLMADRLETTAEKIDESLGDWALSVLDAQSRLEGEALEAYLDSSEKQLARQRALVVALTEIAKVTKKIARDYSAADLAGQRRFAD